MKKNCEFYMDKYLELDKGQLLPLSLTLHLFTCRNCRKEIRALSKAEKASGKPLSVTVPANDPDITKAMQKIDPSYNPQKIHVPLFQWIIAGIVLILALFLLAIKTSPEGHSLNAIYYLFSAGAITVYCMLFVAANLDFFVKKINTTKIL